MKRVLLLVSLLMLVLLAACSSSKNAWGSFTAEKTGSFDQKFYALQNTDGSNVVITVYEKGSDTEVCSFSPARSSDFWGICWEKDTYNIWIQSGDIGVLCYRYTNGQWMLDESAVKPAYIKSKYDK
jgi:hypothetical protein